MVNIKKHFTKLDIDSENLPRHIALIMDGNGRWAQKINQPRIYGHKKGVDTLKNIIDGCIQIGIEHLTVWAFSISNWKRPQDEVYGLMNILRQVLKKDLKDLHEKGIKLTVIGIDKNLPSDLINLINDAIDITKNNKTLNLIIALNYNGRNDIVNATKQIIQNVQEKKISIQDIDENYFAQHLMTADTPDPDLLIRTSGVVRLSNFTMWQCAFTELMFVEKHWPDFNVKDLLQCIKHFQSIERKFGQISSNLL